LAGRVRGVPSISMLRCRLLGHRYRFWSEGDTMHWRCERDCGAQGAKRYPSAVDARRYAGALDREDIEDRGRRAPLLGLLPVRIARALRRRDPGRGS
jgi:hypothetical protein